MPFIYAHNECAARTLALLPEAVRAGLENAPLYAWGAQGPDLWFYHAMFPWMRVPSQRAFGDTLHVKQVDATLAAMLHATKEDENREELFSYFAGFLAHHALDAEAHPYILYRVGPPKLHLRFERDLDLALLKSLGRTLKSDPLPAKLPPIRTRAVKTLYRAVARALGYPLPEEAPGEAVAHTRAAVAWQYDPAGLKTPVVKLLEKAFHKPGAFADGMFAPVLPAGLDFLNLARAPWVAPWGGEEKNTTFLTMLDTAAARAAGDIEAVHAALLCGASEAAALERLGGDSFETGQDWRIDLPRTEFRCIYEEA